MLSGRRKQDYAAETSARPRAAPPPPAPRRPSRSMGSVDLEALLGSVSLFESLDRRALARLAQQASPRVFAPRVAIVGRGGPGDFFGELALIEDHPRSATVVALEETECLLFVVWEFRALLNEHPQMALPIMNALIARLHRAEALG